MVMPGDAHFMLLRVIAVFWFSLLCVVCRFSMSVLAVEYPGYGPAEGEQSEESVNDNIFTAFNYLRSLGYPNENIVLMGYSIGTGPTLNLAATLCNEGTPPGAVVTIAAFLSICDIVRDLRGSVLVSMLAATIDNRWNSAERALSISCPILLIHGMKDEVIPHQHSQRLYELCASEKKFLRLCKDATHTYFEEPVDTIEPIAMFLAEMLRPREDVVLGNIPAARYSCPASVAQRENEVFMKKCT